MIALNRLNVPTELRDLLQRLRDSFTFYSTVERRRLEYLRTANIRVLSMPIGTVDPSKQCVEEMKELQLATTLRRRYDLSQHAWHNCLNGAWLRSSRPYPQNAWSEFLRVYGVTEQFTEKPVD